MPYMIDLLFFFELGKQSFEQRRLEPQQVQSLRSRVRASWGKSKLRVAHATSFSRASHHLLLTRVTLPVREPPARGARRPEQHANCDAYMLMCATAGCAWSRKANIKQ